MKKLSNKQIIGMIGTILATLFAAIYLYNLEFDINASETNALETAIEEYNFTDHFQVEILKTHKLGKYLYVLYKQSDYEGYGGFATLEKGLLGKYRFHNTQNFDHPLYCLESAQIGRKNYLIVFGLNTLPDVKRFEVYGDYEKMNLLYQGDSYSAPILEVIETEDLLHFPPTAVSYYNSAGDEIDAIALKELYSIDDNGNTSSVSSAELGMVYVLIGIVLMLGIVLVRYFWQLESCHKETEQI